MNILPYKEEDKNFYLLLCMVVYSLVLMPLLREQTFLKWLENLSSWQVTLVFL